MDCSVDLSLIAKKEKNKKKRIILRNGVFCVLLCVDGSYGKKFEIGEKKRLGNGSIPFCLLHHPPECLMFLPSSKLILIVFQDVQDLRFNYFFFH